MTSVADRTRAAMDAITSQVDSAPPLPLPPPAVAGRRRRAPSPWRRWGLWLTPAAAAAAVIALAVSLVIVRDAGHPAPTASPAAVPRYYVALPGLLVPSIVSQGARNAVVSDTFSGKRLATVPAPAGWTFVSVASAGGDRTFVAGATQSLAAGPADASRWYLIRLTPGSAHFATLRELPIPPPERPGFIPTSMALSPDGTMLALTKGETAPLVLRIYSTATGSLLHTWSTTSLRGIAAIGTSVSSPSWTSDGRQLAFQESGYNVRLLQVNNQGHDLLADSRVVWSLPASSRRLPVSPTAKRPFGCSGSGPSLPTLLVTGDGKTVLCGASGVFRAPGSFSENDACPAIPPWNEEGVLGYSTATGKVTRTLYRGQSNCVPDGVRLLWTSDSGDAVIGYFQFAGLSAVNTRSVIRFGLFTAGKFTPLPSPPTIRTDPTSVAW
jgi:hypothetical protein